LVSEIAFCRYLSKISSVGTEDTGRLVVFLA